MYAPDRSAGEYGCRKMTIPIHIGDYNPDVAVSVVVALCGATALILPDASVVPETFDFVDPAWPQNATCALCITRAGASADGSLRRGRISVP